MLSHRSTRILIWAALYAVLLTIVGCQQGPPTALVSVAGRVTYKGQPLAGACVLYCPRGRTPGTGAMGVTGSDGRFTLTNQQGRPGTIPGNYLVHISKLTMPDGSAIPMDRTAADVEAVELLPTAYSNPETDSPLTRVMVSGSTSRFRFDIP